VTRRGTYAALLAATALVAGCGSDEEGKPIPSAQVSGLENQLGSIQRRVDAGACRDITEGDDTNLAAVQNQLDQVPSSVDADVRKALRDSFQNLFDLVSKQCQPKQQTQTETQTTETQTQPTETQTIETQTQPTETQTTETQTQPTEPPGQEKKDEGGNGDGDTGGGAAAPGGQ
jgi:hypothetical protein